MSWRTVIIREPAKLDLSLGQMVVRQEKTTRINLDEMAMLILENTAVSITACLLSELTERKIKVILCDSKRNPQAEIIPYYGSHDSSAKIKMQIGWSDIAKEQVWTEIVREKIRNQMLHLSALKNTQAELLRQYLDELLPGDSSNREGHSAKVYFNALFGMDFTRNRDIPINAALNYGYSLLLSSFSREISAAGYLTQLGIFHDNMFNHFNLASDLMEPFRPIVDREVVKMSPEKLENEEKTRLVNLLNTEVTIAGRRQYLQNAIRIYCKSVFDVLNGEEGASIRFYEL
jgi:CRISP-associated protein Cas1